MRDEYIAPIGQQICKSVYMHGSGCRYTHVQSKSSVRFSPPPPQEKKSCMQPWRIKIYMEFEILLEDYSKNDLKFRTHACICMTGVYYMYVVPACMHVLCM